MAYIEANRFQFTNGMKDLIFSGVNSGSLSVIADIKFESVMPSASLHVR